MPETFGARLRRRREEQNVALSTIAEQTKIKLTLLAGLERDDVSHWPSGIFRRAYIRSYAKAIGLCPDVTVREFLEVHPDPGELVTASTAMIAAAERVDSRGGPPTRLHYMVGSAIGSFSRLRRGPLGNHAIPSPVPAIKDKQEPEIDDVLDLPRPGPGEPTRLVATIGVLSSGEPAASWSSGDEAAQAPHDAGAVDSPAAANDASDEETFAGPDLAAVARLCTELGRVQTADALQPLLDEAARILNATGLIVWMWDEAAQELRSALAQGYSDNVLAQLPGVSRAAENATAAAFRFEETCVVEGDDRRTGALVIPLLTTAGCAGVLALELKGGGERSASARAVATILAALLAQVVGTRHDVASPQEISASIAGKRRPVRVNVRSGEYLMVRP